MIADANELQVDEHVVLSKFDGEAVAENEVERITISNGTVVEHSVIKDGEVIGPVDGPDSLSGKEVGRLIPNE